MISPASVAELVDALDSKSSSFGSVGSIPTRGTLNKQLWYLFEVPLVIMHSLFSLYIVKIRGHLYNKILNMKQ